MAETIYRIEIPITAKDEYSAEFDKVDKRARDIEKQLNQYNRKRKKNKQKERIEIEVDVDDKKATKKSKKTKEKIEKEKAEIEVDADTSKASGKGKRIKDDIEKQKPIVEVDVRAKKGTFERFGRGFRALRDVERMEQKLRTSFSSGINKVSQGWSSFRDSTSGRITLTAVDKVSGVVGNIANSVKNLSMMAGAITIGGGAALAIDTAKKGIQNELDHVTVAAMFNDPKKSAPYMEYIEKKALDSPIFDYSEMAKNSKYFLAQTKNLKQLESLWDISEKLMVLDPAQGTEGAAFAVKEMLSGDSISLQERFGFSKEFGNRVKKLGIDEQIREFNKELDRMGLTDEAIEKVGNTAHAKINQAKEGFEGLQRDISAGWTQAIGDVAGKTGDKIEEAREFLDKRYFSNEKFNQLDFKGKADFVWKDLKKAIPKGLEQLKDFWGEHITPKIEGGKKLVGDWWQKTGKPGFQNWWGQHGEPFMIATGEKLGTALMKGIWSGIKSVATLPFKGIKNAFEDAKEQFFADDAMFGDRVGAIGKFAVKSTLWLGAGGLFALWGVARVVGAFRTMKGLADGIGSAMRVAGMVGPKVPKGATPFKMPKGGQVPMGASSVLPGYKAASPWYQPRGSVAPVGAQVWKDPLKGSLNGAHSRLPTQTAQPKALPAPKWLDRLPKLELPWLDKIKNLQMPSWLKNIGPTLGKIFTPLAALTSFTSSDGWSEAIGKFGGGLGGAAGGASLGATIGTALGPIGTALGGLAGGILGGMTGTEFIGSLGAKLDNVLGTHFGGKKGPADMSNQHDFLMQGVGQTDYSAGLTERGRQVVEQTRGEGDTKGWLDFTETKMSDEGMRRVEQAILDLNVDTAGLQAGLDNLQVHLEGSAEAINQTFEPLKEHSTSIANNLTNMDTHLGETIISIVEFGNQFENAGEGIAEGITSIQDHLTQASGHLETFGHQFEGISEGVGNSVTALHEQINESLLGVVEFGNAFRNHSEVIGTNIGTLAMHVGEASGMIHASFQPMQQHATVVTTNLQNMAMYLGESSAGIVAFNAATETAATSMSTIGAQIEAGGSNVGTNLTALATQAGESAGLLASSMTPIPGAASLVVTNLNAIAVQAGAAAGHFGGFSAIGGGVTAVVSALSGLASKIRNVQVQSSISFGGGGGGPVKAYAKGGIATSPHIGLVAEAGVPESMIPHDGSARSKALWMVTGEALGMFDGNASISGERQTSTSPAMSSSADRGNKNQDIIFNFGDLYAGDTESMIQQVLGLVEQKIRSVLATTV